MSDTNGVLTLGSTDRRLDVEAMEGGVEMECLPFRPGFYVTVLPAVSFNKRYRRAIIARTERMSAAKRNGENSAEPASDAAFVTDLYADPEFVVDALVGSMRGIRDQEGRELAYDRGVGLRILTDPGHADVLDWIANEARQYARYYTDRLEEDVKNSPTDSSGNEAGVGESAMSQA